MHRQSIQQIITTITIIAIIIVIITVVIIIILFLAYHQHLHLLLPHGPRHGHGSPVTQGEMVQY